MSSLAARTCAWGALVGATLASAWAVSHLSSQVALVAMIMVLAAGKALVVFHHYMEIAALRAPLRWLFIGWAAGCSAMIVVFAALS